MKTTGIFAFASLLSSSLVVAVPFNKRDIVWVTKTAEVVETVALTKTVWVDAANYRAEATGGEFYGRPHRSQRASSSAPAPTSVAAPTAPTTPTTPAAPVTPSSSSVYVSPATPSTPSSPSAPSETSTPVVVTPVPTSTEAPPPPPASTEAPAAPSTTEAPTPPAYTPPPTSSAAPAPSATPPTSPPGQGVYTGDITHYDVGMGSCGWTSHPDEAVVAIPRNIMANPPNPNDNTKCGKTITISYQGVEHVARIVDTCDGCKETSIDLSNSLFAAVAPNGDGRVPDVNWWFNH